MSCHVTKDGGAWRGGAIDPPREEQTGERGEPIGSGPWPGGKCGERVWSWRRERLSGFEREPLANERARIKIRNVFELLCM